MGDAELRELRRTWERTRAPEDEARWLGARLRSGELHRSWLELAAHLGHEPALEVHPIGSMPRVGVSFVVVSFFSGSQGVIALFPADWIVERGEVYLGESASREAWLPEEEEGIRWAADLLDLVRELEAGERERLSVREVCGRVATALAGWLAGPPPPAEGLEAARNALAARGAAYPTEPDDDDAVDLDDDLDWEDAERGALMELCGATLPHLLLARPSPNRGLERALDLLARDDRLGPATRAAAYARGRPAPPGPVSCLCTVWIAAGQRGVAAMRATVREALVPWLLHTAE